MVRVRRSSQFAVTSRRLASKGRRLEALEERNRLAPVRQPDTSQASAATRFARQGAREPQKQAAGDRALFVSVVLGLPGCRPRPAAADANDSLRIFVSSVCRYSTSFLLTERCQPCELLVHHVAPVWHTRATECAKQTGPLPEQRASRSQATRAKTRAQRTRTRFGLVKPVAVASLPKVLKPDVDAEATSMCTHRTARGVRGGRVSIDDVGLRETRRGVAETTTDGNP